MVQEDGSTYEGNWVDDKMQGWGKFTDVNGEVYEGEWHDNLLTAQAQNPNQREAPGRGENQYPVVAVGGALVLSYFLIKKIMK